MEPDSSQAQESLIDWGVALESALTAEESSAAFSKLVSAIGRLIRAGRIEEAATAIRQAAVARLDYTSAQSLARLAKTCRAQGAASGQKTRLAVLASFTSIQLAGMIELFLFAGGVDAEVYQAEFGVFRQEIIDPNSPMYRFGPHTIFIATTWRDLSHWPALDDEPARAADLVIAEAGQSSALWRLAHERCPAQIIQSNFAQPAWRQLGNHEMRHPASRGRFIEQVNRELFASAPPYVTIHDVDELSARVGRRHWDDERFFHQAKLPCNPESLVTYAHDVASILLAQLGLAKKCLVLDLDDTLWGGVIGDDGPGGIRLGPGSAEGEAFLAFQRYAKRLAERGVLLAVCSKNDESIARQAFVEHPAMALKLDDISCFMANWDDKPANIRAIAGALNIDLSALVFLDDNPAERALVRRTLPSVAVPEVRGDPSHFIEVLEENRYFQVVGLSAEDLRRTEIYQADARRRQTLASAPTNLDEYLQSLQMTARIEPISDANVERSAQLISKSNQFNLTTIRRSAAELSALAADPNWLTLTVSLADRFGDNGLISVLLARVDGAALDIDTWVMSCRVLKRNVENCLLNELCALAGLMGIGLVRGQYVPTAKNGLVRDHYSKLGFSPVAVEPSGATRYELKLAEYRPQESWIVVQRGVR